MITAVDTSVLIAVAKGEAEAYRWTDLLATARAEGDLVICDVVAAEFFALLLDERKFQQSLSGLGIGFSPTALDAARLAAGFSVATAAKAGRASTWSRIS